MTGKQTITLVVGARPNFMKAAPLIRALRSANSSRPIRLIHTGQHFDENMSTVFFRDLELPQPDAYLGVQSSNPVVQLARITQQLGEQFTQFPPEVVVVFGDVNSTLAAALTANKMGLPLAHVEAGLRSFDRSMPEEHNRVLTDHLADLLLTPSEDANENLLREGIPASRISMVGNIMVDSLLFLKPKAIEADTFKRFKVEEQGYALVTLHRPGNVDNPAELKNVLDALAVIAEEMPVIFPVHPRTHLRLKELGLNTTVPGLYLTEPQGYLEFFNLMINAKVVLTDSGGIQEETTVLGVPCLTLRNSTERPITLTKGTNRLVGTQSSNIVQAFHEVKDVPSSLGEIPPLWDGKTSQRIVSALSDLLTSKAGGQS